MERRKDFKKGVSQEDGRRRREANAVALRKDKKEEGLSKRRNLAILDEDVEVSQDAGTPDKPVKKSYTVADIPALMAGLQSIDCDAQLECLRGFRKLLSSEKNAPIKHCIDCGAVPLFVQFLQRNDAVGLQFEAAWALTNIASSDKTSVVVEYHAVPHLVRLLMSPDADVREQCGWCLGNIAGDCASLRDVVLNYGVLSPLLANITDPNVSITALRNFTWSLSNMCRGKPQPPLAVLAPALPLLAQILTRCNDIDTLVDAAWALSYVSDGENSRIQAVIDLGVLPRLVEMLSSNSGQIIVPALRTLGNLVTGDDSQTQAVVNAGVLAVVTPLLSQAKKSIRKEACWLLSNISAGTQDQITALTATPELLARVIGQLSAATEWEVRKEASWVVSNIASVGKVHHVHQLAATGAIGPLCELLNVGDVKTLVMAMETIEAVLKVDVGGKYAQLVDEAGGTDKLETLQQHENEDVYNRSVHILESYFGGEEEDESENIAPAVVNNAGTASFAFGIVPDMSSKPSAGFSFGGGDSSSKPQSVFNFSGSTPFFGNQM